MDIIDWTVHHIKQKDMMRHDLVSYQQSTDRVICELKDGKATYFCWENLELEKIKAVEPEEISYFVCFCNEHNFKLLVDNWDLLKTRQNFSFIFLNPNLFEKWVIKPFVHARIADQVSLKQGLRTMYETCLGKDNG